MFSGFPFLSFILHYPKKMGVLQNNEEPPIWVSSPFLEARSFGAAWNGTLDASLGEPRTGPEAPAGGGWKVTQKKSRLLSQGSLYFPLKDHPHQGILTCHGPKR